MELGKPARALTDEVQSKINAPKEGTAPKIAKLNPLTSKSAMAELNPASVPAKKRAREEQLKGEKSKRKRKSPGKAITAAKTAFYKSMVAEE